jgi:hypothetical protein
MEVEPSPPSPRGTSDDNKRISKMKSWGRMISIRATSTAESAEDNSAGRSASQLSSNEHERSGPMISESSLRADPVAGRLPQTPSAEPASPGGSSQFQNGAQNSPNSRILVRHRSTRTSSHVLDQEKDVTSSMRNSARTSRDRHCA